MTPYFRPRRSMLYVPGCNTRYLNKARTLKVDSVILDLGDPILVEAKEESRRNVVEAVLAGGYGRREVVVRVNDLDSPWGRDDVKAVANIGADAILFPNIESKADVEQALSALDAAALAVYTHGMAGDALASEGAPQGLLASELCMALPRALKQASAG